MKRRRNELVPKVIPRNRRFSICRDLVATEKSVYSIKSIPDERDKRNISSIYINAFICLTLSLSSLSLPLWLLTALCGSS